MCQELQVWPPFSVTTAIGGQQHDVRVLGVEPAVLVVLAPGAPERQPALAAVDGLPRDRAGHDQLVRILRMWQRHRQVAATDAPGRPGIAADERPALAGIIAAIDAAGAPALIEETGLVGAGDRGIEPARICGEIARFACTTTGSRWVGRPGRAAIGGLEDPTVGTARTAFSRPLPLFPGRMSGGVGGSMSHVVRTCVLVLVEHLLERGHRRAIGTPLLVGPRGDRGAKIRSGLRGSMARPGSAARRRPRCPGPPRRPICRPRSRWTGQDGEDLPRCRRR